MQVRRTPRVLVVSAVPPTNSGGMQLSTAYVCEALGLLGLHVTLIAPQVEGNDTSLLPHSVKHLHVPVARFYYPNFIRSLHRAFDEAIGEQKPIALISESAGGYSVLQRCQSARIPFVFHAHGTALRELRAAWSMRSTARFFYRIALLGVDRILLPRVQAIAAVSQVIAAELRSVRWLRNCPVIRYVPNGIPTRLFLPDMGGRGLVRNQFSIPASAKVIAFVGRLTAPKGVDLLLAALPKLIIDQQMEVFLWILGAGEARQSLERQARALGVAARVIFHGRVPPSTVKRLVNAADVFALPSRRPEGLPYALIEAQALGIPAVVSDALEIGSESVIYHRNNDQNDLARALGVAMAREAPDLALSEQIRVRHSLESQAHSLEAILSEIGAVQVSP